jgi:hypothetical protein
MHSTPTRPGHRPALARPPAPRQRPTARHHGRDVLTTPCDAVARLHTRCSAPDHRDRSPSACPRSHGCPGRIGLPQRAQVANPAATNPARERRIR